ncbi:MAG: tRNA modification GTPase MnmE [Myxococcota bacterium]|nr:tRNA modification GTPase MnmE [Myxococcota bacterium]
MIHRENSADTIAAIATAAGEGGVGIVRISGPRAKTTLSRLFRRAGTHPSWESRRMYFGQVINAGGEFLDEGLAVLMAAPHSYTGEDVAELHVHGGRANLAQVLRAVLDAGCRPAGPGEFTRRAFLNGRMSLEKAEAVADLIAAEGERGLRQARLHLRGALGERLRAIRERLADSLALLEAFVDFPEEDLGGSQMEEVLAAIDGARGEAQRLIASYARGRLDADGARVVIAGRPNAGKSSLLNLLAGEEKAIVSEIPGATRDAIDVRLNVDGWIVHLTDTAGLRESGDALESRGVEIARRKAAEADLILWIVDGARAGILDDRELFPASAAPVIVVINKSDLARNPLLAEQARELGAAGRVFLSALTGEGVEELRGLISSRLREIAPGSSEDIAITRERHAAALERFDSALDRTGQALRRGDSPEFAAADLREALSWLGELTGEVTTDDLLDRIFTRFCIGK